MNNDEYQQSIKLKSIDLSIDLLNLVKEKYKHLDAFGQANIIQCTITLMMAHIINFLNLDDEKINEYIKVFESDLLYTIKMLYKNENVEH